MLSVDNKVLNDLAYLSCIYLGMPQILWYEESALYIGSVQGKAGGIPDELR